MKTIFVILLLLVVIVVSASYLGLFNTKETAKSIKDVTGLDQKLQDLAPTGKTEGTDLRALFDSIKAKLEESLEKDLEEFEPVIEQYTKALSLDLARQFLNTYFIFVKSAKCDDQLLKMISSKPEYLKGILGYESSHQYLLAHIFNSKLSGLFKEAFVPGKESYFRQDYLDRLSQPFKILDDVNGEKRDDALKWAHEEMRKGITREEWLKGNMEGMVLQGSAVVSQHVQKFGELAEAFLSKFADAKEKK